MKRIQFILQPLFVGSSSKKAFTLIEVLISLSIFSTIVYFMAPIFQIILNQKSTQMELQEMEWDVFCSQIKKEISTVSRADILSGRLILTKGTDTVQYEKYGQNVRRRVNSNGHEIVLQNVSQYSVSLVNNGVKITVVDVWGKEYSVTAFSFLKWSTGT
ncbi:competence type IV pilus minor pilin ComGF [Neobacillus cucumis]|uniref:competence type IV pilus minor pilin ComGF n=1 Tax=Neobacillus cucumis TaxID=1740721 RepID=UPI0028533CEB|nr:competence type IV pilus minor pilin ComGF [Neobacillus cucumis]MDR4948574.1 competence type IV pilus minor pilin ComGF [Neobacillus cucumis]